MKKVDVVWIDGFKYTKREYHKYFPQGHGNRTAIPETVYTESFIDRLSGVMKKAAYYAVLVVLFAVLFYVIYRMGHASIIQR